VPLHIAIIGLIVLWLIPTIGLFINSLRPPAEVTQSGWWTAIFAPSQLSFDNYAHVLAESNIGTAFVNSLFISIPATIIPVLVASFAAYAFAWMEFPGRNILFVVVVGLLVVPLQTTLIPILQLYGPRGLNIAGSFLTVWLAHTAYGYCSPRRRGWSGRRVPRWLRRSRPRSWRRSCWLGRSLRG